MAKHGIKSIALTMETTNSKVWKDVENGEYQFVVASPEILLRNKATWWTICRGDNAFMNNIFGIVIDEFHCIWSWGTGFQCEYSCIGQLRDLFRHVVWYGCSATLTRRPLEYGLKTTRMTDVEVIRETIARPNITLFVAEIQHSDFSDLKFLVPKGISKASNIPPALAFADNINEIGEIVTYLWTLLPDSLQSEKRELVRVYHADLPDIVRQMYMDDFQAGKTRILVCTDACGLGVNIREVDYVVQWKLTCKLDIEGLVQRIGRAGRKREIDAAAIIFVNINAFVTTTHGSHDYRKMHLYAECMTPVTPEAIEQLTRARDTINFDRDSHSQTAPSRLDLRKPGTSGNSPWWSINPHIIALINAPGCRHKTMLFYMEDPKVFEFIPDCGCCDWCIVNKLNQSQEPVSFDELAQFTRHVELLIRSMPFRTSKHAMPLASVESRKRTRAQPLKKERKDVLDKCIRDWRQTVVTSSKLYIRPVSLLPNDVIEKLVKAALKIHTVSDLEDVLKGCGYGFPSALIYRHLGELFKVISDNLAMTAEPRKRTNYKRKNSSATEIRQPLGDISNSER
jgi:hypothetical protein